MPHQASAAVAIAATTSGGVLVGRRPPGRGGGGPPGVRSAGGPPFPGAPLIESPYHSRRSPTHAAGHSRPIATVADRAATVWSKGTPPAGPGRLTTGGQVKADLRAPSTN